MSTIALARRAAATPQTFGLESNGILMTPEEFDRADFDENWTYELINGVLIVSPIPSEKEVDPNEELGHMLRTYREYHPQGKALDKTLPERHVNTGRNRRRADRLIWAGLGRLPRRGETPSVIVEFVSKRKRDRKRDYETKRDEYFAIRVAEYWIIDCFQRIMTAFIRAGAKFRKRVITAGQIYRTDLLPGFELPLDRLFGLADEWDRNRETDLPSD